MRQLIKEALKAIKESKENFIYVDEKGKSVKLEEAAKKGIPVTPVDVKVKALEKLKSGGLDLSKAEIRSDLMELLELLGEKKDHIPKKMDPVVYNKEEILDRWFQYAQAEENANAEEFAEQHHVGYDTLASWINQVKPH